jgi:hypothetical protein
MSRLNLAAFSGACATALVIASAPAFAGVFEIDQFIITKNSMIPGNFFLDDFTDGNAPPSAPNLGSGNMVTYNVNGGGISEANGVASIDNDQGALTVFQTGNFLGNFATLQSNIQDESISTNGLKQGASFSATGIYNLIIPTENSEAYGIRLTDRSAQQAGDETMELVFARNAQGDLVVSFRDRDFLNLVVTPIAGYTFGGANYNLGANDAQIALTLDHAVAGTTGVSASFALLDSMGAVNFSHSFQNTGDIFSNETWTRAQFMSFSPIPEPATLTLAGLGLAGLGLAARRRRTA